MKKKKQIKNLNLNKQTVAHLNQQFMPYIQGGSQSLQFCTNSLFITTASTNDPNSIKCYRVVIDPRGDETGYTECNCAPTGTECQTE